MAGRPYEAGGIRATTEATRAATTERARRADARRRRPRRCAPASRTSRSSPATGSTSPTSARCCAVAARAAPTTSPSSAPTSCRPSTRAAPTTTSSSSADEMLAACAPHARWIDAFCERGAFDADQCRAVLEAGRAAGLGLRVHANQLGHGPGVQLAVELGAASADHCTYLDDADVEALAGERHRGDVPAGDRLLDPPALPRRPPRDRRRRHRRDRHELQPGSSYTTSMSFCIALAVRDLRMTRRGGPPRPRRSAAPRRCAATTSAGSRPGARADRVVLDAPSPRAPRLPPGRAADRRHVRRRPSGLARRRATLVTCD